MTPAEWPADWRDWVLVAGICGLTVGATIGLMVGEWIGGHSPREHPDV